MPTPLWKPGQSGNPKGRPPKARALTEILERAGSATIEVEGKRISGKRLVARLVWEALTTGVLSLPIEAGAPPVRRVICSDEWITLAKWVFAQIDGPPRAEIDVTSDGKSLRPELTDEERIARLAAIFESARARGTGQDSPDQ